MSEKLLTKFATLQSDKIDAGRDGGVGTSVLEIEVAEPFVAVLKHVANLWLALLFVVLH